MKLPTLVSPHIQSLIDIPEIARQFIPSDKEEEDADGFDDPLEENSHSVTDRLIHRYGNRAAFLTTDKCFAYCRYCFRKRFTGGSVGDATDDDIAAASEYLSRHSEIREVLLTGGDFFALSDERISRVLSEFKRSRPDIVLRLCTRSLLSNPGRFSPSLFKVLDDNTIGAPYYLMVQFNHPAEITEDVEGIILRFLKSGIPALNQSVLLRGVNDNPDILEELCNKLIMNRIKPYYLFQTDLVRGTSHMRVPVPQGLEIEKELRRRLSGIAMPEYTLDLPNGGGKVILTENHIIGPEGDNLLFSTPDGEIRKYPKS